MHPGMCADWCIDGLLPPGTNKAAQHGWTSTKIMHRTDLFWLCCSWGSWIWEPTTSLAVCPTHGATWHRQAPSPLHVFVLKWIPAVTCASQSWTSMLLNLGQSCNPAHSHACVFRYSLFLILCTGSCTCTVLFCCKQVHWDTDLVAIKILCAQKVPVYGVGLMLICSWRHASWAITSSLAACQVHGARWFGYAHLSISCNA